MGALEMNEMPKCKYCNTLLIPINIGDTVKRLYPANTPLARYKVVGVAEMEDGSTGYITAWLNSDGEPDLEKTRCYPAEKLWRV